MEIPTTKILCDAERFCEGLRLIAEECNMSKVAYNKIGAVDVEFEDGSSVGMVTAFRKAGIIKGL
jgi:hypothetical protein